MMVSQLIDQVPFGWKASLINDLFDPKSANVILSIHLPSSPRPGKLLWTPNPSGNFSIKSTYHIVTQPHFPPPQANVIWGNLWKLKAPKRTKMFLWRLGTNTILTKEKLLHRISIDDPSCVLCGCDIESTCHLFINCSVAKVIWHSSC